MSNPHQGAALKVEPAMEPASPASWKQEINARLSAHRSRRTPGGENQAPLPGMEAGRRPETGRAARVAARVAERYSKAPTYSEMLAAEAARAAEAAAAAAEAARQAHEVAQAMTEALRAHLDEEKEIAASQRLEPVEVRSSEPEEKRYEQLPVFAAPAFDAPVAPIPEPAPIQYHVHPDSLPEQRPSPYSAQARPASQAATRAAMDEYTDVFEDTVVAPAQPLPVRILEFPRELVATRKARPRHAEGPLREDSDRTQLRIFEVEPESISREPVSADKEASAHAPEWHSIRLDAHPDAHSPATPGNRSQSEAPAPGLGRRTQSPAQPSRQSAGSRSQLLDMLPVYVAPMEDRMMAAIVDSALVMVAFLLFLLVFVACTAHPPVGKGAMAAAGAALVAFFALYQWLFFTYAEGTPGMRYARVALCTFDDENPGRRSMQWRIAALLLSALPLGLGFLWALFDEDRLCWHDRITHTYQRSYR